MKGKYELAVIMVQIAVGKTMYGKACQLPKFNFKEES